MKKYWLLLILPAVLLPWWGLGRSDSGPEVDFATVRKTDIESTVPTNGKVEPVQWAAARAETSGVVRTVDIQLGQRVHAGQVLVNLDTTSARAELASALASKEQAQADATALAQGGKASTQAELEDQIRTAKAAVAVAQRNLEALKRLATRQAATKVQVQDAKDALDRANLSLAGLEDKRKTLVTASDQAVAQAKVHDAQAAVSLAQHKIALGEVRSPISGTVYQFDLKVGAYLEPGGLVAYIGKLDQVKVTVYVDEPDLGRVGLNMPVAITWDARPGQKWYGRVDKLPTQVIALGTRTVGEVTTIVDNPNHDLLPGVTVNATIISKIVKDAASIPKAALRTIGSTNGVYKLTGRTIVWTPVKTGISDINNVQILSGLQVGDRVADRVVEPSDAELQNGMSVRPVSGT
ncbi:MAG TPA: efflux RND transporter periplasmic adaptor subunit [Bryobacteraceae bacterium]|jgi:HlyD family secretion protein|nr:efflux RND transporter periplasmic adaptor subunit [Bryobacteraceae bacterium]